MQHFFVSPGSIGEKEIRITGEDVNHIKNVLRMKPGEVISISNGVDDDDYRCEIAEISQEEVICKIMFVKKDGIELPARIVLYQGLPKADKMEMIIQKAVELGVSEIVPVATKRCVVVLDNKKAKSKITRWQAISEAAAKQSKRAIVPVVRDVMTFKDAINEASLLDSAAIPYEMCEGMQDTKLWIDDVINKCQEKVPSVAIFIGPEGGFDEKEIELALGNGVKPVSLGRRILRTETAGMTTLSILMYHLEVLNV